MQLIFATHNINKLQEVQSMMPSQIELLSLTDIGITQDIPETATTIQGNAILKMQYVAQRHDLPVFADDTGLEIAALNNEPGVYSARYAGPEKDSNANMNLVLEKLKNHSNRDAHFMTVIALFMNGKEQLFKGICKGSITHSPIGDFGFGYDPIFQPLNYQETFAQMNMTQKSKISHRGLALKQLINHLTLLVN